MNMNAVQYKWLTSLISGVVLGFVLIAPGIASGGVLTIESDTFSLNYGFNNNGSNVGAWTSNPSSSTTSTVQGDFSFLPSFTNPKGSDYGVTFQNGVLTNGAAQYSFAGDSNGFVMTLNGSWNGPTPVDAAADPNYRISIVIDVISIYGLANASVSPSRNLQFSETTAGHLATSPSVTVMGVTNAPTGFMSATNYTQLLWDPSDYFTDGVSGGRTFTVTGNRVIDGFQISGRVVVSYDAVPEPSSYAMLIAGLGVVLFFGRRRLLFSPSRD